MVHSFVATDESRRTVNSFGLNVGLPSTRKQNFWRLLVAEMLLRIGPANDRLLALQLSLLRTCPIRTKATKADDSRQ